MLTNSNSWTEGKPWLTKNKMILIGFMAGIILQIAIAELIFG